MRRTPRSSQRLRPSRPPLADRTWSHRTSFHARTRTEPSGGSGTGPTRGPGPDWELASRGRFPGRWNDRDGTFRTIYVAETLLACLAEVLAVFRPGHHDGR